MIYTKYSCPKCKATISDWAPKYITFGNPFVTCNKCGFVTKMDNINEWEAMVFLKKIDYVAIFYGNIAILSFIGALLFEILFTKIFESNIFIYVDNLTRIGVFFIILVTLIMLIIRYIKFMKAIIRSKERTRDKEYLRLLKR